VILVPDSKFKPVEGEARRIVITTGQAAADDSNSSDGRILIGTNILPFLTQICRVAKSGGKLTNEESLYLAH